MVLPLCGAAQMAGAAGSAAATGLGLGMGKTDLDLAKDLFKQQMRQAKRLWTADWAENSLRHGESCMQSAQQHFESQSMATVSYLQAEKLASQGIKLARDQDSRSYEMTWRAEVRESLRDELSNQNSRFNIIMLCDTVCLGCVFTFVADGNLPIGTHAMMINAYVFCMGLSVMLFSISLWCAVIVVRRLYEHTAAILERKLFCASEELQKAWAHQLANNLPTGPNEMYLLNQAYQKWVSIHLDPIGKASIQLMSIGVVFMFITAGLFIHNTYLIDHNLYAPIFIFWSFVFITSVTVIFMNVTENRREKKKEGVYDNSWQDTNTFELGPFAKILQSAQQLFSSDAIGLADAQRVQSISEQEQEQRDFCTKTHSLAGRVNRLREESQRRTKMRKDVLKLLTTAAEELDALPEELTSQLNQMLYEIEEADSKTAQFINIPSQKTKRRLEKSSFNQSFVERDSNSMLAKKPMSPPIDAHSVRLSLPSIRKKLGELPVTTLLRLRNISDEPLRLKSGLQLKKGQYIKSLKTTDTHGNTACYHLFPISEIKPRSEVVVVARSGSGYMRYSGIDGAISYTNRDQSWTMKISFINSLINMRTCKVDAYCNVDDEDPSQDESLLEEGHYVDKKNKDQYWIISKDELDTKANNEIAITIDVLRGEEATKAATQYRQSQVSLKSGYLLRSRNYGLGLQWIQKYLILTPKDIICSPDSTSATQNKIALYNVRNVIPTTDMVKNYVFEIHVIVDGGNDTSIPFVYKLAADSLGDRDDWINKISHAAGIDNHRHGSDTESEFEWIDGHNLKKSSSTSKDLSAVECVHGVSGTDVYSV